MDQLFKMGKQLIKSKSRSGGGHQRGGITYDDSYYYQNAQQNYSSYYPQYDYNYPNYTNNYPNANFAPGPSGSHQNQNASSSSILNIFRGQNGNF